MGYGVWKGCRKTYKLSKGEAEGTTSAILSACFFLARSTAAVAKLCGSIGGSAFGFGWLGGSTLVMPFASAAARISRLTSEVI